MIERAIERLIDNVWTVEFERVDGGVKILRFDRKNPIGYRDEKKLPRCRLIEDQENNKRIVLELVLGSGSIGQFKEEERLKVVNPQNIFSYKEETNGA